jgi:hypothetical protein
MTKTVEPRYSNEEFARRGDAMYERDVLPRLGSDDEGKYAAIDIETGAFEVDQHDLVASNRLLARYPEAQIWLRRIGARYTRRFGRRSTATSA